MSVQHSQINPSTPECTLDDGAGHVSSRPPPISLVYSTAELIDVDVYAHEHSFIWMIYAVLLYYRNIKC